MIKAIPIREEPLFIVVTVFDKDYYHYHLNDLSSVNKNCDIGVWKIKYKQ